MIKAISTKDLSISDLPPKDADWNQLSLFALTFDWFAEAPESKFKSVSTSFDEDTPVKELRALLYFQQRWWNNRSGGIDSDGLDRMHKIIELIRSKLT